MIALCVAWGLGYGLLWASKWMMGYLLTGNNILTDAMQSAELRTSNQYKGMEMTIPNIIRFIWTNIEAKGLIPLFYAGIVGILLCLGLYLKCSRADRYSRNIAGCCLS